MLSSMGNKQYSLNNLCPLFCTFGHRGKSLGYDLNNYHNFTKRKKKSKERKKRCFWTIFSEAP